MISQTYFEVKWNESHSVVSDSLWPHELYSAWNSPGQSTGVGSLSLLQGIFLTWESNPGLLHCRRILYQLNHTREAKRYFIQAYFSPYPPHFSVHAHHLGILLKCRFWFSGSGLCMSNKHPGHGDTDAPGPQTTPWVAELLRRGLVSSRDHYQALGGPVSECERQAPVCKREGSALVSPP